MKLLVVGTDRKLFEEKSSVRSRMLFLAEKFEEVHIIVFSTKKSKLENQKINNLFLYPTSSISKFFYILDAYKISKKISQPSIVSSQDPFETGLTGYFIANFFKVPLQIQIHTDFLAESFGFNILNIIRRTIAYFILSKASGIRAVSSVLAQKIKQRYKLKNSPDVLPVFIDSESILNKKPSFFTKNIYPQFSEVILMASRITKEKNIDLAIKSFAKILKKMPKTGLLISGQGPESDNLKTLSQKLGISDSVVFLGWQNDLVSWMKTSDVFLQTSFYEGYGMSFVEAALSGCPIVTTSVGLAGEVCKDGQNSFVISGGEDELSNKLLGILSNQNLRLSFRQEMNNDIRNIFYTKEKYSETYFDLYSKLIK